MKELEEQNIILRIPKHTMRLKVDAGVLEGDTVIQYRREFDDEDVQEMRQKFLEYLEDDDYDARYVITELGEEYLRELEEEHKRGIY